MPTPNDPTGEPTPGDAAATPPVENPTEAYPPIPPVQPIVAPDYSTPAAPAADATPAGYPPAPPTSGQTAPTTPLPGAGTPAAPAPPYAQPGYPVTPAGYGQAPAAQPAPQQYGQPAYGQPAYGQAPYGQAGYAQPGFTPGPDTRSKKLATISAIVVGVGIILCLLGFLPIAWVGLGAAILGGLALIVGFIMSIVALAGRSHGGKGWSIAALVVSVLGSGLWFISLFFGIGMTVYQTTDQFSTGFNEGQIDVQPSDPGAGIDDEATDPDAVPEDGTDGTTDETALSAGEQAFVDEVRPRMNELAEEAGTGYTASMLDSVMTDDLLLTLGYSVSFYEDPEDRASLVEGFAEVFGEAGAQEFIELVYSAAQANL